MEQKQRAWAAFLVVVVSTVFGVWRAAQGVRSYAHYPPDFDEAVHLLPVWQIANSIKHGDLAGFWQHTLDQEQLAAYPFFHSWLSFPAWLATPQITTVRVMSLVYVAGAVLLAFDIGRTLCRNGRFCWLAGLVSAGLTLTAFPLWVYGSLAYLEAAGLLLTFLALWFYVRSEAGPERPFLLATSLAVAAAFFTKYSFGLFLAGGIALNEGTRFLRQRHVHWRRLLYLAGPAVLLILLWFTDVDKWHRFLTYSQAQQGQRQFWEPESWLYYPGSLYRHYATGILSILLIGGGLLAGFYRWQDRRHRALLSYFVVGLLILVVVPQKEPRFLYTVAPAIYPLAGALAVAGANQWRRWSRRWRILSAVLLLALLAREATAVYKRFSFFTPALEVAYASAPETAAAYRFIRNRSLDQNQRVHLLNSWHLFSPYALQWSYHTAGGNGSMVGHDQWATASLAPKPTRANLAQLAIQLQQQGTQILVSIDGSPAGDYTGWAVVEPLLAQGILTPVASSPHYTLHVWSDTYRDQILAGAFANETDWQAARAEGRAQFSIQLHLYRVAE